MNTHRFRILDLFCGAGGFSYGMHMNPQFTTVVASDFNEQAAHTFARNMPSAHVITGDIKDTAIKNQIIEESISRGVNMIVGGPPCQGFSMKGKKLGLEDERNYLFLEYLKIVETIQPEVFVIGGGVSNEGENLLAPLRVAVDKEKYDGTDSPLFKDCVIVKASLGNDAGIVGAALLRE